MRKLMTVVILAMLLAACGGNGGFNQGADVTAPECVPKAYPDNHCAEEGFVGEYRLTAFGLEQASTGFIIYNEMDYWPFYGTMTIDVWELTRQIQKTPSGYNEFSRDSYTFYVDGELRGVGRNGEYVIDGAFLMFRWSGNHYIGNTDWGRCWTYEWWEKVANF